MQQQGNLEEENKFTLLCCYLKKIIYISRDIVFCCVVGCGSWVVDCFIVFVIVGCGLWVLSVRFWERKNETAKNGRWNSGTRSSVRQEQGTTNRCHPRGNVLTESIFPMPHTRADYLQLTRDTSDQPWPCCIIIQVSSDCFRCVSNNRHRETF